jgi:hypothetical protein
MIERNGTRPSFDEVLAAIGEPRDRVDRLAIFTATQVNNLLAAIAS